MCHSRCASRARSAGGIARTIAKYKQAGVTVGIYAGPVSEAIHYAAMGVTILILPPSALMYAIIGETDDMIHQLHFHSSD